MILEGECLGTAAPLEAAPRRFRLWICVSKGVTQRSQEAGLLSKCYFLFKYIQLLYILETPCGVVVRVPDQDVRDSGMKPPSAIKMC